MTKITGVTVRR